MATQTIPPVSMSDLLNNAALPADQKAYLINIQSALAWQRVCALKAGAGASTACRLLGKEAGFHKGTTAKEAINMLAAVSIGAVALAITAEEEKKTTLLQEDLDAGTITQEQHDEKLEGITESYANARAWLASLQLGDLVSDLKFIREYRNTISVTIKTAKAFGARCIVTIDETISEFLGKPIKNADVAKACQQGLARFEQ